MHHAAVIDGDRLSSTIARLYRDPGTSSSACPRRVEGGWAPASIADLRLADGELLDMMKLSDLRWGTTLNFARRHTAVSDLEPTADGAPVLCGQWFSFVAEPDEAFTFNGSVSCRVGRLAYTDLEPQSVS